MNHPCLCLIAPISQHIMLPQSTVATALIFNWVLPRGMCALSELVMKELNFAIDVSMLVIGME